MANLSNINGYFNVTDTGLVNVVNGGLYVTKSSGDAIVGIISSGGSGKPYYLRSNTSGNFAIYDDIACLERLTILSGGNVGIGTTSPTNAKLVISDTGSDKISIDGGTSQNGMRWEAVGGANGFYLFNGTFGTAGFGLYNINTTQAPLWIQNGGNVGVGTTSPNKKLEILSTASDHLRLAYSGSAYWDLFQNAADGSFRILKDNGSLFTFAQSGNLGIGTTSPGAKLEVIGTAATYTNASTVFWGGTTNNDNHNGIMLSSFGDALGGSLASNLLYSNSNTPTQTNTNRSSGQIKFGNTTVASKTSDINFGGYYKGTTTFIERMRIDSSGNVGINDTNPSGAAGYTYLTINNASNGTAISFKESSTERAAIYYTNSTNLFNIYATETGSQLVFGTNAAERMRIDSSGNVGIGTTSPKTSLDIVKDADIWHLMVGGATKKLLVAGQAASGDVVLQAGAASTPNNAAVTTAYNLCLQRDGGNVGISDTNPTTKLSVGGTVKVTGSGTGLLLYGTGGGGNIDAFGSNSLVLMTNSTERARIDSSGNVGIGTTNPSRKLQVEGGDFYTSDKSDTTGASVGYGGSSFQIRNGSTSEDLNFDIFNRTTSAWGTPLIIKNTGNVGIGTTSPTADLSVGSTSTSSGDVHLRTTKTTFSMTPSNTDAGGILIDVGWVSGGQGPLKFGIGGTEKMRINSSGNVGIGESSLSGSNTILDLKKTGTDRGTNIRFKNDYNSNLYIGISGDSSGNALIYNQNNSDIVMYVGAAGTERMRIDSSGLVRIQKNTASTTEPLLKLSNANGSTTDGVKMIFEVANTSGNGGEIAVVRDGGSFNPYMTFNVSSGVASAPTERMRIDSNGILKFPNAAQTRKIQLWGTQDNDYEFYGFGVEGSTLVYSTYTTGDDHVFFAGTSSTTRNELMRIGGDGNVGIGTTNPQKTLDVTGTFAISNNTTNYWDFDRNNLNGTLHIADTGTDRMSLTIGGTLTVSGDVVAYGSPSDKRLKENIKPIKSALEKVTKLQGVTFDWKESDSLLEIKEDIGFIAQDVQKVMPELVRENKDGMLSMRHQGIAPILLEAIKELKAEIEELKKHSCDCKK